MAKRKPARKGKKKPTPVKKQARKKKPKKPAPKKRPRRGKKLVENSVTVQRRGLGARSGGQSGDIEGLSDDASADSESVEELAEEGQAFESEVISGVENAPDPDEAEVTTHEILEDDVPSEYGGES